MTRGIYVDLLKLKSLQLCDLKISSLGWWWDYLVRLEDHIKTKQNNIRPIAEGNCSCSRTVSNQCYYSVNFFSSHSWWLKAFYVDLCINKIACDSKTFFISWHYICMYNYLRHSTLTETKNKILLSILNQCYLVLNNATGLCFFFRVLNLSAVPTHRAGGDIDWPVFWDSVRHLAIDFSPGGKLWTMCYFLYHIWGTCTALVTWCAGFSPTSLSYSLTAHAFELLGLSQHIHSSSMHM